MKSNIKKLFSKLFLTHLFLNITNCLCRIASGYIAGNLLDSIALSCSSIVSPYNSIVFGIATIHSTAGEILCGKYMGVGDKKSINKTFTNSVIVTFIVGVILTALSLIFTKPLLTLLGATQQIISAATSYFQAYSLGIVPILLMPVLASFLHMEDEGKYVTISVVLLAVSYAIFGFLFIKVFELSYFGFGLTNSLSQTITVLFLLARLYKNRNQISLDIKHLNIKFILNMYSLGISAGTAGMMVGFRNIVLNKVWMETGGAIALATYSVIASSVCLLDAVVTSTLETCIITSSIFVGERNNGDLTNLIKILFTRVWPIYLVLVIIQDTSAPYICSFFSNDNAVIELSITFMRLYLCSTIFEIISTPLISIYTVLDHKKFANIFNILHCLIIHPIFAMSFKKLFGLYTVSYGYIFTEVISLIILIVFTCIKQKKLINKFSDFVLFKENYDVPKYSITISEENEVVNISKDIIDFCESNNIEPRRSKITGLCIEEMVINIFEHGFTKKETKNKKVDVFLLVENETVSIRIRDNSIAFDPTSRNTIFNPEDPCKNIGIRTVSKLSKEMTYQNMFGFNNMIIKI